MLEKIHRINKQIRILVDKVFPVPNWMNIQTAIKIRLLISILVFITVIKSFFGIALFLMVLVTYLDAIDGTLARRDNFNHRFLDDASDRITEFFFAASLLFHFELVGIILLGCAIYNALKLYLSFWFPSIPIMQIFFIFILVKLFSQ